MIRFPIWVLLLSAAAAAQNFNFQPGAPYPAQNLPVATAQADFNGDSKLDLAVANAGSSTISIFLGKGDGTFTAAAPVSLPGGCTLSDLAPGDFNRDGKPDLLAVCTLQSAIWMVPGLGSGQFGTPIPVNTDLLNWDGLIGIFINGLAVADFTGDGILDFAILTVQSLESNAEGFAVTLFKGNGNGTFTQQSALSYGSSTFASTMVTADFNNDGIPDLAVGSNVIDKGGNSSSQILIYRGTGQGGFQQAASYNVSGVVLGGNMTVADVNRDGKPDLIVAWGTTVSSGGIPEAEIATFVGNGDFTFQQSASEFEANGIAELLAADFRGTGTTDLLEEQVAFQVQHSIQLNSVSLVLRAGNGDGTFQAPTTVTLPAGLRPLWIRGVVGDWNGDGLPDLAFTASPASATFALSFGSSGTTAADLSTDYQAMPPGDLVVMLNGATPPAAIKLSTTQVQLAGMAGSTNSPSSSVLLSNGGGRTLNWTATPSVSWLSVSPTSGTGNATLSISAAIGSLAPAPYTGSIQISAAGAGNSPQTISVTLTVTAPSTQPQITGVVNGASFLPGIESGSWVTIQGTNLSNTNPGRTWTASEIVDGNLPTSLDGTSVAIDGKPAFVYYISPTQLNVQAPTDSATGTVNVVVTNNGQVSSAFPAQMQTYAPAFFLYGATSYAIASHYPDYGLVGNPNLIPGTVAAHPGDILILWATGFGPTTPPTQAGVTVTGAPAASITPVVTLGGVPLTVLGTVLTPGTAGLYQVAVQLPASLPSGAQMLQASAGGTESPATVLLFVAAQ